MPQSIRSMKEFVSASILCALCAAVMFSVVASGCGKSGTKSAGNGATGSKSSDIRKDLSALGRAYANHIDATRKGPADWQSLIEKSPSEADAIKRVREAGYTVNWNLTYRGATQGVSNTVLAESPSGGPKLMLDGSVTK